MYEAGLRFQNIMRLQKYKKTQHRKQINSVLI